MVLPIYESLRRRAVYEIGRDVQIGKDAIAQSVKDRLTFVNFVGLYAVGMMADNQIRPRVDDASRRGDIRRFRQIYLLCPPMNGDGHDLRSPFPCLDDIAPDSSDADFSGSGASVPAQYRRGRRASIAKQTDRYSVYVYKQRIVEPIIRIARSEVGDPVIIQLFKRVLEAHFPVIQDMVIREADR